MPGTTAPCGNTSASQTAFVGNGQPPVLPKSALARPRSSMRPTAPTRSSCNSWTQPPPISPTIRTLLKPDTRSEARRPRHCCAAGRTWQTAPGAGGPVGPFRRTDVDCHSHIADLDRARRPADTRTGPTLREQRPAHALLCHDRSDLLGRTRRIGQVFGHLGDADMVAVNRALALFTGIAR